MKRKLYLFTALMFAGSLAGKAQINSQPLTRLDSASYGFGFKIAQSLKSDGVNSLNYDLVVKAMKAVFEGTPTLVTDAQASDAIGVFLGEATKQKHSASIAEEEKFLAENKKKKSVKTTESGLQYETLVIGTGAKPTASDAVTVHYKGTLLNGKQFDSSYDRGEPISFPLSGVIPGWTEGLQLMPVGSKFRFYIPSKLGYGENGAGSSIPPYSTLIFDVELLKIGK